MEAASKYDMIDSRRSSNSFLSYFECEAFAEVQIEWSE